MKICETLVIDGLVQESRNSGVLAMELRLSWTNPSLWNTLSPTTSGCSQPAVTKDLWNFFEEAQK